jgi:hypothetical protein
MHAPIMSGEDQKTKFETGPRVCLSAVIPLNLIAYRSNYSETDEERFSSTAGPVIVLQCRRSVEAVCRF